MNIIVTTKEDLEDLVRTSVEATLEDFYTRKSKAEKQTQNLSIRETAVLLNVAELTVRNYIKRGLIKAERIGNRIFINRKDLQKSLKEVKSLKYKR